MFCYNTGKDADKWLCTKIRRKIPKSRKASHTQQVDCVVFLYWNNLTPQRTLLETKAAAEVKIARYINLNTTNWSKYFAD